MTRLETYMGMVLVALHLLILPVILVWCNTLLPVPLTGAELNFLLFLTMFVLTLAVFHKFLWKNLENALSRLSDCLLSTLVGFGIYLAGNLVVNMLILNLSPNFSNVNDANIASMSSTHYALMAFATVLLVPVFEETLYRGLLFQGIYRHSRVLSYAVSVVGFAAIHVVGYIGASDPLTLLLCLLQYLPAGFALAWAYEKADSIFSPILMHCVINLIGILAMR